MDFYIIKCAFLLICALQLTDQHSLRGAKRPPAGFNRAAVEGLPTFYRSTNRNAAFKDGFGSKSIPLRSAVESIPEMTISTRRLPLRDSVEKRPPPDIPYEGTDLDFDRTAFKNKGIIYVERPVENYLQPIFTPKFTPLHQFHSIISDYRLNSPYRIDNGFQQVLFQSGFPPRFARSFSPKNFDSTIEQNLKIVCYIEGAASHRKQPFAFNPNDLDPFACTHVIYAFANIDSHSFEIISRDVEYDIIQGGYLSATGLKRDNPELKVLISIGGRRGESANFSTMIASASKRRHFIRSLISFMKEHNFDGVDLHWLYPGADDFGGHHADKDYYILFLEELSEIFRPKNWIISVSAPASRFRVEDGYNPSKITKTVDFINLQAYDFHGDREPVADHHAPLKPRPDDDDLDVFNNADYAVKYWLKKGLPRNKLVLGIPFFGRSFTLLHPTENKIGSPIRGPGKPGYYTQRPGFLSYFEICDMIINEGWTKGIDAIGSPYIVNGDQWVGYDNTESIQQKMNYIKDMQLGGVFAWSTDLDDFRGLCGDKWPLLNAIKISLKGGNSHAVDTTENLPTKPYGTCDSDGLYSDRRDCSSYFICRSGFSYHLTCGAGLMFDPTTGKCDYININQCRPGHTIHIPSGAKYHELLRKEADDQSRVVCYLTNWAFYRKGEGKFVPEHLEQGLCTHIVYAFASLDPETLLMKEFDPFADIDNNLYDRVTSISNTKVLLSLGGWTDSAGDKYSRLVSDGSTRRKFVIGAVSFLRKHKFQGLHLDWNYPVCWQSNCKKGAASDKANFAKLIQELKKEFDKQNPPLILAAAISGYKEVIDVAYDLPTLGKELDFMSVMTYDYHGSWEKQTGHVSPLYEKPGDNYPQYNTKYTLEYLVANGAPKSKLVVGIPFYGQTFTLAKHNNNYEIGVPTAGPGEPGEFTKQPGMLAYHEICNRVRNQRWIQSKSVSGPYAYSKNQWVGFDDPESAYEKAKFIKANGYGGAVAWTIDLDDFTNKCCQGTFPLLRSINRGLGLIDDVTPQPDCTKPKEPVTPPAPTLTTGVDSGAASSSTPETIWSTTTRKSTQWWVPETTTSRRTTTTTTTKRTTTTRRSTTSFYPAESTTIPPMGVVMPEVEQETTPKKCEGAQYAPDPHNCNAYYRCILGEMKKQYCAGGLHWNKDRSICDWPASAQCKEHTISDEIPHYASTTKKPFTTTTQRTTTVRHTTTRRPTAGSLEKCRTGQYYPHESCNSFYVCANGQLVTQRCAPGLQWNADEMMCDWGYKVKCYDRKKMSQVSDKYNKVSDEGASTPYSACEAGSFAAYAGDCSQYLICLWGKFEPFTCAPGLHWNMEKKICDWPDNAKCAEGDGSIIETKPEKPERPTYRPPTTPKPTKKPTQITTSEPQKPLTPKDDYFKIVCYFTNWAWYRQGNGKYLPEDINPDLCTHIVYGFAVLDYEQLIIKPHDTWADIDNKFYERVTALKKQGKKVTIAIGGWNDSQGDKYSRLVNNPASRAKFIDHVIEFIQTHNFDGLDLDWEYPKCWQTDCSKGPASDKDAFGAFVRELSAAFKPYGLLLSAAVTPNKMIVDDGYDVQAVAESLDWIAVMTYDYHGQWDKVTGHLAPFYYHPDDATDYFNANYSIHYWISQGAPARKLVMGIPLYGQSFRLTKQEEHGLNAPASGPGEAGEFTRAAGFLSYYEICTKINTGEWTVVQDEEGRMGPYAYNGYQWVGFDNKEIVRAKVQFIKDMNLGGGMVWALDLDDFKNVCGGGKYPLLSTIREGLATGRGDKPEEQHKPVIAKPTKPTPPKVEEKPMKPQPIHTTAPAIINRESEFKVVCYFTNWAWYRQGGGKYLPEDIDPDLCTHIIYGFAVLNGDQGVIKPHDSWADIDNKFYQRVTAYKAKGIKVLVAIGGWNDSAGDKYSKLVNNPSSRSRFIKDVVEFIEKYNFDGLDLDWEYPKCWQVDCNKGPDSDKQAFSAWIKELHAAFAPRGWLLTAAVSPAKRVIDAGYDVPALAQYLDFISVMTYDYHGQWDKVTGHIAPMYDHPEDIDVTFNINFTIHYWIEQGASPKKLVMGLPMYGQSFSLADNSNHGLNAPTYGGGEAGDQTRARGFLSYYEICQNIRQKSWIVERDPEMSIGPYAYSSGQWVSFDDIDMIRYKSEFIKKMGLGGGMIWALDLDDFKNTCDCETYPLLKTINRVLRNYPGPAPKCQLGKSVLAEEPPKRPMAQPTRRPVQTTSYPIVSGDQTGLPCNGKLFVPHETKCNAYYLCNHNVLELKQCSPGLFWAGDHCDWPENAKCHPDHTTLVPEVTKKPTGISSLRPKDDYKVVCYFTNWAWYRPGKGKFIPDDIDADLCTHIMYGFAILDPETLTIAPHDSWTDIDNEFYKKVIAYQAMGIKVLIAIGGWNDSFGDKYSRLVNSPSARANFIRDVEEYIQTWGFDGLDLDWEYPVCWQNECEAGPESDKQAYATFLSELRAAFDVHGWLLTSAVSASKKVVDAGYDVQAVSDNLDIISIMTYDYHGSWDGQTGHVAPIYYHPQDEEETFNINFTINYWIEQGADPKKIVMGVPLYGQSFTLNDPTENGLNALANAPGLPGEFTQQSGFLAFYEICQKVKDDNWKVVRDRKQRMGPYAYGGNQWVGYDDIADVKLKANLVKDWGLGGGMIWALDLDDFLSTCGCGPNPLLHMLNHVLRDVPLESQLENCT